MTKTKIFCMSLLLFGSSIMSFCVLSLAHSKYKEIQTLPKTSNGKIKNFLFCIVRRRSWSVSRRWLPQQQRHRNQADNRNWKDSSTVSTDTTCCSQQLVACYRRCLNSVKNGCVCVSVGAFIHVGNRKFLNK